MTLAVLAALLAAYRLGHDRGQKIAGFDHQAANRQIEHLRDQLERLEADTKNLRILADTGQSHVQIEMSAQQQLAAQIKILEQENRRLKEDLAFFESLASSESSPPGITISQLRIDPEVLPGQYRFALLVAAQGGQKGHEIQGKIQLLIKVLQDGKSAMIIFPEDSESSASGFDLKFKYFQRLSGSFQIPAKARITAVEARLLQGEIVRASRILTL